VHEEQGLALPSHGVSEVVPLPPVAASLAAEPVGDLAATHLQPPVVEREAAYAANSQRHPPFHPTSQETIDIRHRTGMQRPGSLLTIREPRIASGLIM
jgi:hypothetical protein